VQDLLLLVLDVETHLPIIRDITKIYWNMNH